MLCCLNQFFGQKVKVLVWNFSSQLFCHTQDFEHKNRTEKKTMNEWKTKWRTSTPRDETNTKKQFEAQEPKIKLRLKKVKTQNNLK